MSIIMETANFYHLLSEYCATLPAEFAAIPTQRQAKLQELGNYFYRKRKAGEPVQVTVICTHNSRRSHMGQLWLLAAAAWYGIEGVSAYSGGTQSTAFHPNAVAALRRAGFLITPTTSQVPNPIYEARYTEQQEPMIMYSKTYDDNVNPHVHFAAVMVCSEADAACPFVPGADERFALPFHDPKDYDGTPMETGKYDEACRLIARDLFFAVQHAKERLTADTVRDKISENE